MSYNSVMSAASSMKMPILLLSNPGGKSFTAGTHQVTRNFWQMALSWLSILPMSPHSTSRCLMIFFQPGDGNIIVDLVKRAYERVIPASQSGLVVWRSFVASSREGGSFRDSKSLEILFGSWVLEECSRSPTSESAHFRFPL